METAKPWYKSDVFRNLLAFVAGALVTLFTAQTGITPKEPPAWLLPIITEVKATSEVVKELKAQNAAILAK
jgi:hypothetical protein